MSAITNNYIGYKALISYLSERKNWSYCGFLNLNQDTIIASLISLTNNSSLSLAKWQSFDAAWYNRFLDEAKELLEPNTFATLKKKTITEHLQHKRNLQTFWQEIIKECIINKEKKEIGNQGNVKKNLVPTITTVTFFQNQDKELVPTITAITSFPKESSKDQQEENLTNTITTITSLSKETIDQNLIPTVISFPKETIKVSIKNLSKTSQSNFPKKNIKLINFCYDILHKLENNSYAHLFYKYNE
ncbi:hypothetical protein GLOIN_2v63147 [Rhizophagus clarus]|uniref:Uncharacterized protein n=1 Tax=Rhizophagus clarus TaxID=94130 RepID=A0A8H3QIA6_9GLOM|nr:hypothetical protein GLOIN_2v63147 [Rhizophagus clarus]